MDGSPLQNGTSHSPTKTANEFLERLAAYEAGQARWYALTPDGRCHLMMETWTDPVHWYEEEAIAALAWAKQCDLALWGQAKAVFRAVGGWAPELEAAVEACIARKTPAPKEKSPPSPAIKETFGTLVTAFQEVEPWASQCWYDVVRELPMCGEEVLSDAMVSRAAFALERGAHIPIRNLRLVQSALVYQCRATPRDLLQEWLWTLPAWDGVSRLTEWLADHAGVVKTSYTMDVARLWPVSMVARAVDPGCQYRNVIVLEGAENLGKSKLVKTMASLEWYRELSHGLEGKEAHMILQGAWVAELAELASYGKTEEARLKSFITMERDEYVPKFANAPVSRKRRTVFVATHNPEGDGAYLRGQTGNTRWLPVAVTHIDVEGVAAIREQLFAEAQVYYREHPADWWQLSSDGQTEAAKEREARRQSSVYEETLGVWLQHKVQTTWEEIAQQYLLLEAKERWKDRGLQMDIAKALRALGWRSKQQWHGGRNVRLWVAP